MLFCSKPWNKSFHWTYLNFLGEKKLWKETMTHYEDTNYIIICNISQKKRNVQQVMSRWQIVLCNAKIYAMPSIHPTGLWNTQTLCFIQVQLGKVTRQLWDFPTWKTYMPNLFITCSLAIFKGSSQFYCCFKFLHQLTIFYP